jgi:hypothetical protein
MSAMAMGDECRIDLVTGKTITGVRGSAEQLRQAIYQSGGSLLLRVPTDGDGAIWVNPAHIVVVQDTDPGDVAAASG